MYFTRLLLKNYRNYDHLSVDFHKNVNIIIGDNAQGKTNLLESIYITSLGKSFRTNSDNDLIKFGQSASSVTTFSVRDDINDLENSVELRYSNGKKSIFVNGIRKKKNIDLLENNYVVIFSPEDLGIVKDEPEKRRKFIDRELCQIKPIYYKSLARYKKIILHRNSLLKSDYVDENYLYVWNRELSEYGSRIIQYRNKFINKLSVICMRIHKNITDGAEELEVCYDPDIEPREDLDSQISYFSEVTDSSHSNDLRRRTTTRGPHRDDIKLLVNGIDIRTFGSQGQQRTAALSLKLAELSLIYEEVGVKPVLLLDDVLSELDYTRQKFLINSFNDTQIFLTTTEIHDIIVDSIPDYNIYHVNKGTVTKDAKAGNIISGD